MIDTEGLFELLLGEGFDPEFVEEEEEITIICPLCEDDKPRLHVNAGSGTWICFHCDARGSFMDLFRQVIGLNPDEAYEANRKLRTEDDRPRAATSKAEPENDTPPEDVDLPTGYRPFVDLEDHREDRVNAQAPYLNYLLGRGISLQTAMTRRMGYAVNGKYRHRVIVPAYTGGILYGYMARTILKTCPVCLAPLDSCMCEPPYKKVLQPDGGHPKMTLYNYDFVLRSEAKRAIVMEGWGDALRLPLEGLALMGSSISPHQIRLLHALHLRGKEIIICLDGDEAGRSGAKKVTEALISCMIPCKLAQLPDGVDPGSAVMIVLQDRLIQAREVIW